MIGTTPPNVCPIWHTPASELPTSGDYRDITSVRAGGRYTISRNAQLALRELSDRQRALLTTWIVNQRRAGVSVPRVLAANVDAAATNSPMPFGSRLNRMFEFLQDRIERVGQAFDLIYLQQWTDTAKEITAWMECIDEPEMKEMLVLLLEEGYFTATRDFPTQLILTSKGYQRLDTLRSDGAANNRVFVAMWYDKSLHQAFDLGIKEAILDAGYEPVNLNNSSYLESINDRIIAEIRQSHFVVADFTCDTPEIDGIKRGIARGNVYFEAGYALGLRIPVIWCCRSDCIGDLHFDTSQFPHLAWETPEDLRINLRTRIISLFGATDRARLPHG